MPQKLGKIYAPRVSTKFPEHEDGFSPAFLLKDTKKEEKFYLPGRGTEICIEKMKGCSEKGSESP
jgi:hypothetical protein